HRAWPGGAAADRAADWPYRGGAVAPAHPARSPAGADGAGTLAAEAGKGPLRRRVGQQGADGVGADLRPHGGGIESEVVEPMGMHRLLPAAYRLGDAWAMGVKAALWVGIAAAHDLLERAEDADEQHVQPGQAPGAGGQDAQRARIGVVMAEI